MQTTPEKKGGRPGKEAAPKRASQHTADPKVASTEKQASFSSAVSMIETHETGRSPWNREDFDGTKLEELIESIRQRGIIQPIVVRENPGYTLRQDPDGGPWHVVSKEGTEVSGPVPRNAAEGIQRDLNFPLWEIIAGERRWRAAQAIGLRSIPAIVRKASDRETLEIQATENLQREDLNVIHEAQKYRQLIDVYRAAGANGEAVDLVAKHVGRSRSHVYEKVKLLTLAADAQAAIVSGRLPSSHAALITKIEDPDVQAEIAERMLKPQEHEVDEDESDAPLAQRLTVMSFRNAKHLVEQTVECIEAAKAYDAAVKLAKAEGRKVLSAAEIKKVMPYGYVNSTDYVAADSKTFEYSGSAGEAKTWAELVGKHAPPVVIGRDRDGAPVQLFLKKDLTAALKAAGVKKPAAPKAPKRKKSAQEIAREQAHTRREALFANWRGQIAGKMNERGILALALAQLHDVCSIDPAALGVGDGDKDDDAALVEAITKLTAPRIREILLNTALEESKPNAWHREWHVSLKLISQLTGVALPEWEVQTSGKDAE